MWAPTLAGQGEPATAPFVPWEAWEGGSLCPAHRELTHRALEGGGRVLRGAEVGGETGLGGTRGLEMRLGEVDIEDW